MVTPSQRTYRAYLKSPHWQRVRARILRRAGSRCEWCGRFCGANPHPWELWCGDDTCGWCATYFDDEGERNVAEEQSLEIHHLTYERIGDERDADLVALCWSCHDAVTERALILRGLYRQGLIPKALSTVRAAGTRFWEACRGALTRNRR